MENQERSRKIKKLTENEAKKVAGGYQCKYCSFSSASKEKMKLHYLNIHNVKWNG